MLVLSKTFSCNAVSYDEASSEGHDSLDWRTAGIWACLLSDEPAALLRYTHTLHIRVVFTAHGRRRCPKPFSPPPSSWVLTDRLCDWLVKKTTWEINSTCLKRWEVANQRRTTKVECLEERHWATTCCWCSLFIGNNWKNNAGAQKNKKAPGGHGFLHTLQIQMCISWIYFVNIVVSPGSVSGKSIPLKAMPLPPPQSSAYSMPAPSVHGNHTPASTNQMLDYLESQVRGMDMASPLLQVCNYRYILKSFQFKCKLFLQSFLFNSL